MQYILISVLSFLFIMFVGLDEAKAKPSNNDGICETIVVENGEVISREESPCE
jgi:hypothetical protein